MTTDRLEQAGFGRLDVSSFGLWLNVDAVVTSRVAAQLAPLTLSSFHFGLNDRHRSFVSSLEGGELRLALHCFTLFAHERRHFHDLLATSYGSMLMRQYTRAALIGLACRRDLFFRSTAIGVPLADWVPNAELFTLAYGVQRPSENLHQLHETFSVMQEKLAVFNQGIAALPKPFEGVTATSILEALAILAQEHEVGKHFGDQNIAVFRTAFRAPAVELKYYGALALCAALLGRGIPTECLAYCLLSSLCGDFQNPNPNTLRYPTDLLLGLLLWLRTKGDRRDLGNFDRFACQVDNFFEHTYGDDVQGVSMRAAKTNEQASAAFLQLAIDQETRLDSDAVPRRVVEVFDNFRKVQAAFAANVMISPSWYVGAAYSANSSSLPIPVIFLESETGLPIDASMEEMYYIQTESRLNLSVFPAATAAAFRHLADRDGIVRAAHVLSPRAKRFPGPAGKYPLRFQFQVPEVDVDLWQQVFDSSAAMLRFLLEGPDGMLEPLKKTILLAFGMVGVRVYARSGELLSPPLPDDPDDPVIDPEIRRLLQVDWFREALRLLRARSIDSHA